MLISPRSEQNMKKLAPAATFAQYSPEQTAQLARQWYARRALIETAICVVKRKLSARAPEHSLFTQTRQALLLGLAFNLHRLRHP